MSNRWNSSEGSLAMTMLVAIVLGGVIVTLFTVVRTGVDSSGRDRDFASAINVADAGVQEAYLILLDLDDEALEVPSTPVLDCAPPADFGGTPPTVTSGVCEVKVEDGSYVWSYDRIGDSRNWRVESWGTYRDSTRMVSAVAGIQSMFSTAILAVEDLDFSGGGTSVTGGECNIDPFTIGAGGAIKLTGHTGACISYITVYGSTTDVSGSSYGTFDTGCDPDDPTDCFISYTTDSLDDLENKANTAFATNGICTEPDSEIVSTLPSVLEKGTVYCVDGNVTLNSTRTVAGDPADPEVSVYISGDLRFAAGSVTNFSESSDTRAADLAFFVGGTSVTIQSTARAKAGVYAPAAFCHSQGGAGANGQFAGAMTCNEVHISGNWTYDASVAEIGSDEFGIRHWAERPPRGGPPSS